MFKIYDGRIEFFQWDLDRKLIISDPTITEVHFCNKTDDCSLVVEVYEEGGQRLANVPNILLQDSWDIRVYGYCGNCYTKQMARFKVVGRTKPADYVYTETEVKNWEAIEERCEEVLELAESIAKGSVLPLVANNYEEMITAFNATAKDSYSVGQNIYVVTVNVPDLWVMEVTETAEPYTYSSDEAFVNGISENGYVQVGYYKLAQLETKGNLTDYVKKFENTTSVPYVYTDDKTYQHYLAQSDSKYDVRNIPMIFGNAAGKNKPSNGYLITNNPVNAYHCANKQYVDNAIAAAGGGGLKLYKHILGTQLGTIKLLSYSNEIKTESVPNSMYNPDYPDEGDEYLDIYVIPQFIFGYHGRSKVLSIDWAIDNIYIAMISSIGWIQDTEINIYSHQVEEYNGGDI